MEIAVPRYFFHIHSQKGTTRDFEGQDLPDAESAREEALKAIGELSGDVAAKLAATSMLIEITDETGRTILNLALPAGEATPDDGDASGENDLA
jgi:hypothetical protein